MIIKQCPHASDAITLFDSFLSLQIDVIFKLNIDIQNK